MSLELRNNKLIAFSPLALVLFLLVITRNLAGYGFPITLFWDIMTVGVYLLLLLWNVFPQTQAARGQQVGNKISMWWKWLRKSLLLFFGLLPGLFFGVFLRVYGPMFEGEEAKYYGVGEFFFGFVLTSLPMAIFLLVLTSYRLLHTPILQRSPYFLFQVSFTTTAWFLIALEAGFVTYITTLMYLMRLSVIN